MRIAMAGNPNSGKTTMYNALTGRSEKIGNWAGVTVDKKESVIKKKYYDGDKELIAVDLPGAYSMSPFTSEESITSGYVKNEHPDAIINIVDATNLSRSLFFTTQLLELGVPVVVALNKNDANDKKGNAIDEKLLSEKLGCPVIKTVATSEVGLKEVVKAAAELEGKGQKEVYVQGNVDLTDKAAVEAADRKRFEFVNKIVSEVENRKVLTKDKNVGDAIDNIITHPVLGIVIFAAIMWLVFYISQTTVGTWLADILAGWIDTFKEFVGEKMADANPLLYALLVDGIIGGVGAVVGFLPLVMVMYFLIALLEDCGYMSRATVVLDPIFKRVGLSGKSVIPMIIGTGCGIPAIMACRTIRNERERRATAMLATFMPCGAKLPVIALFAGAFFPESRWVSFICYMGGILLILLGALLIKAITGMKYRKSFFIIELPEYKVPSLMFAVKSMLERGKAYIIKAGTIILVCNTVVQIMQTFDFGFHPVEEGMESTSILAGVAGPFAYLLVPIVGIVSWQLAAAAITGFIAKENVVGTIATVFAISNLIDTEELELIGEGNAVAAVMGITKVAALAYLMFNLYTPPCFAALGAMNSEMKSAKWLWGAIGLQLATGFTVGFLVYQIGTLITAGTVGAGFVPGLIAIAVFACVIVYLIKKNQKAMVLEYKLD
ncbi:ferrous iron transporter B [Butyrivibrio sp. DSM 10294]|uniref:ferrous iron transporter B n=1 Tax=Butyrivibrio sp. DSM 10294 TaxID=2972457 RepID=UPI00234E7F83|nr:ferrous iron transporter B [Butyrivibrio sp. DSM 10294]MDC7292028.1 ferrous iron transporter B [Butyrivibrio sp. DSM 10294]